MQRNKLLLLASSLATFLLLLVAAYQENFLREWRVIQRAYRRQLPPAQAADFSLQLRQLYIPSLGATDRCISCHVGMAPGENVAKGHPVFGSHPDVVHDPADFGCVVCHAGQGRATYEADAHGTAPHWPEPMIPERYAYAGCGSCHTHLAVPNLRTLEQGRALFERYDCLACHRMDDRGGTLRPGGAAGIDGPPLSRAGATEYDRRWYERHLEHRETATEGPWRGSFGPLSEEDRRAIEVYLASRVGAPGLVEAKALFHSLGCRGCHKVGEVGGDDGPDLTREGQKDPGRLDYSHVRGEHMLAGWIAEHFRSPAAVAPGSAMPQLGLSEAEIDSLTFYMLSLRRSETPEAYWPKDRIRAQRFEEREFATDGATLYGTFCAACHGPRGEGMRYPGMTSFPAIGNPDFLAVASDRFVRESVRRGRPGRRMPAWGEKEGGLRPREIDALVAYVRSLAPGVPSPDESRPARWVAGDRTAGARLYQENCAACHGEKGQGVEGPALANRAFLASATDDYLVETIRRGRRETSMPSFGGTATTHRQLSDEEIASIATFIRSWETKP